MTGHRRHVRRAVTAAVSVLTAVALAGCGVPVDRSPSALPRRNIPFDLLRPSSRSTTTTTVSPVAVTVPIYLVGPAGHLVAVTREVPATPDELAAVLGALVKGPTNEEAAAGLESAVPLRTTVIDAAVGDNGLATVNLGGTYGHLVGQAQIDAAAQIVFTASAVHGVTAVSFELAGQAANVPVASGAQVPVAGPSDFASLAPVPT